MVSNPREENVQHPVARRGIGFDARGVEDLVGKVAAEKAPVRTIDAAVNVLLVATDNPVGEGGERAVGEKGAVLDKGLMNKGFGGDEDGGVGANWESEDGAIFGVELGKQGFEL